MWNGFPARRWRRLLPALVLIAVAGVAAPQARAAGWSDARTLATDVAYPAAAVLAEPDGTAVAAWRSEPDHGRTQLFAATRSAAGAWSAPAVVATAASRRWGLESARADGRTHEEAALHDDPIGLVQSVSGPMLVWVASNCFSSEGHCAYRVQASLLEPGGAWSAPATVMSAKRAMTGVDVAATADGTVLAAWQETDGRSRPNRERDLAAVYRGSWSAPRSVTRWVPMQTVHGRDVGEGAPQVLLSPDRRVAAVAWLHTSDRWHRGRQGPTHQQMRARALTPEGLGRTSALRLPTVDDWTEFSGPNTTLGTDGRIAALGYALFHPASIAKGHRRRHPLESWIVAVRTPSGVRRRTLATVSAASLGIQYWDGAPAFIAQPSRTVVFWPGGPRGVRSAVLPAGASRFAGRDVFLPSNPIVGPHVSLADGTLALFWGEGVTTLAPGSTSWHAADAAMPADSGGEAMPLDAAVQADGSVLVVGVLHATANGDVDVATFTP
jgi:hypothetical protein